MKNTYIKNLDELSDKLCDCYGRLKLFISTSEKCFILDIKSVDMPINKEGCTICLRECYSHFGCHEIPLDIPRKAFTTVRKWKRLFAAYVLALEEIRETYGDFTITDYDLVTWV